MDGVVQRLSGDDVERATLDLRDMCLDSGTNRVAAARAGAIEALIPLLSCASDPVRTNAARALTSVCRHNDANRARAADAGATAPLVELLSSRSDAAKEAAARALNSITMSTAAQAKVVDAGAIQPLVELLSCPSDRAKAQAAWALRNISYNSDYQVKVANAGAIRPLVQLLSSPSDRVKEAVSAALWAIILARKDDRRTLQRSGEAPMAVYSAATSSDHLGSRTNEALDALDAADAHGDASAAAAGESPVAPCINFIRSTRTSTTAAIAATHLANECVNPDNRAEATRCGAVEALLPLLMDSSDLARKGAVLALISLCATPANRRKVERLVAMCFAPNERTVAAQSPGNCVSLWDALTDRLISTLRGHKAEIVVILFSNDSTAVVTGAKDMTVRAWDVDTGVCRGIEAIKRGEPIVAAAKRVLRSYVEPFLCKSRTPSTASKA